MGSLGIPSVRVDALAGFLFVNLDLEALPLKEMVLGIEAELLSYAPDARQGVLSSRSSIQCYPSQALNTFLWVPLAVGQALLIREWCFDRAGPTPEQQEAIERDWATTVVEDLSIIESVQRGMASRGYQPGPLIVDPSDIAGVHAENSVAHLQGLLLDGLAES